MSADGDIVRGAFDKLRYHGLASDDAKIAPALVALARLEAAEDENRDAVLAIAEYAEADSPNDLPGAVDWLIREDARNRIAKLANQSLVKANRETVAQRDALAEALRLVIGHEGHHSDASYCLIESIDAARAALAEAGLE